MDEHEQWSEKVRSQCFCPPLPDKNRNYEGIWSNKRKSFVKPVGMNGSNFKNEMLFSECLLQLYIITTRNGTNFYVTWLSLLYKFTRFSIYFLFLSDEGPMLETLDYTIRIGSTSTFLYFNLYLYSAYAAHYVY